MRQAQGGARRGKAQRGGHACARRPAAARGRALGGGGVLARPGPVGGGGRRRRGGDSTAAAADSGGEKLGEREEVAVELTEGSFWAGNGRRWKLGVEGRSSGKTAMAGNDLSSISAGFGHGRARGWSEWVDGEAAQLGVRRIEAGWRGLAGGITNDGRRDELGFAQSSHCARKGNGMDCTGNLSV